MINFFITSKHAFTILDYLKYWHPEDRVELSILSYEKIVAHLKQGQPLALAKGCCLFSDIERLPPDLMAMAGEIAATAQKSGLRVLNAPQAVLRRFELLDQLYKHGINDFAVYKVGEAPRRYPVFVRVANDHRGSRTNLLSDAVELRTAVSDLLKQGFAEDELIVVEYVHVANSDGVFRKYGCHLIGDTLVADHLFFSLNWMTKMKGIITDDPFLKEEREYVYSEPNLHDAELRKIFEIAGIDFGRIDYGIVNGRIQVWEINTNPYFAGSQQRVMPERLDLNRYVYRTISEAFRVLSAEAPAPIISNQINARALDCESQGRFAWL